MFYTAQVMKKTDLVEKNLVGQVIAERNALAITKSPFCVNLYYCLQTTNNVFLVSKCAVYKNYFRISYYKEERKKGETFLKEFFSDITNL